MSQLFNRTAFRLAYFVLAHAETGKTGVDSNISEADIFTSRYQAMEALDIHHSWATALHGRKAIASSVWFVQEAVLGYGAPPSPGKHYLSTQTENGRQPVAGRFSTITSALHWMPFAVHAIRREFDTDPSIDIISDAVLHDRIDVSYIWFRPMSSRQVYPMDLA
ncbi:hypothetical protein [Rhodococcus erythropolis]|uniref:hypothetical protein n=1 Tax=Rhodococcus erythropolis TaxID=1833 RepID=UPI0030134FF2